MGLAELTPDELAALAAAESEVDSFFGRSIDRDFGLNSARGDTSGGTPLAGASASEAPPLVRSQTLPPRPAQRAVPRHESEDKDEEARPAAPGGDVTTPRSSARRQVLGEEARILGKPGAGPRSLKRQMTWV